MGWREPENGRLPGYPREPLTEFGRLNRLQDNWFFKDFLPAYLKIYIYGEMREKKSRAKNVVGLTTQ